MTVRPVFALVGFVFALSTVACAAEPTSGEVVDTVPAVESDSHEDLARGTGLTCPAGSSLCVKLCCPTGSVCTILRDGTELCQVSPIQPKLSSFAVAR